MNRIVRGSRRIARLSWRQRGRAAEAVTLLALAGIATRLLPFRWTVAAVGRLGSGGSPREDAREIAQTMEACANRLPWRSVCFQRGLAAHVMLRRRGLPSVLHYGVEQSPERGLSAHVWVSVGGRVLVGAGGLAGHVCLARFPADAED
jgi:hypothetical protein